MRARAARALRFGCSGDSERGVQRFPVEAPFQHLIDTRDLPIAVQAQVSVQAFAQFGGGTRILGDQNDRTAQFFGLRQDALIRMQPPGQYHAARRSLQRGELDVRPVSAGDDGLVRHALEDAQGRIGLHGADAELYATDAARKRDNLDWDTWAGRFNEYLLRIEELIWPDKIIIGGGASKKGDKFFHHLTTKAKVVPAQLMNEAGIVGAAMVSKYYNQLEKENRKS